MEFVKVSPQLKVDSQANGVGMASNVSTHLEIGSIEHASDHLSNPHLVSFLCAATFLLRFIFQMSFFLLILKLFITHYYKFLLVPIIHRQEHTIQLAQDTVASGL